MLVSLMNITVGPVEQNVHFGSTYSPMPVFINKGSDLLSDVPVS